MRVQFLHAGAVPRSYWLDSVRQIPRKYTKAEMLSDEILHHIGRHNIELR